jgi:RNase_H superfamily
MWQQFVEKVAQYPDAPIYHYGSYEPRAISILAKRYETDAENVTKRLVNVNGYIYGKVYFPVRSNGLKDIGNFIGAKWTSPQASGLQSLVWRHHWEKTVVYPNPADNAISAKTGKTAMTSATSSFKMAQGNALARFRRVRCSSAPQAPRTVHHLALHPRCLWFDRTLVGPHRLHVAS